jgi:DNA processing protein
MRGGVGDRRKRVLIERFGGPADVLRLGWEEVAEATGSGTAKARAFVESRPDTGAVLEALGRAGGALLAWDDPAYPLLLKETHDPPLVLFVRGDVSILSRPAVGLVGARRADPGAYGWTRGMASVLAGCGFAVVSGFARGIDEAAHAGTLAVGGETAAVLGTGIDVAYPSEHASLAKEIAERGVLVTELPPGTEPEAGHFPKRNRILAGLSIAVVVLQAAEKSGAMITARLALEAGRDVFVLAAPPWDVRFGGNRKLAREGAAVVQDGEEVALLLGRTPPETGGSERPTARLTGVDREVAEALADGPCTADEICRSIRRSVSEVLPLLLRLELSGLVEERPGKTFALVTGG